MRGQPHNVNSPTTPGMTNDPLLNSKFCGNKYIKTENLQQMIRLPNNEKLFRDYVSSVYFNEIDSYNEDLQKIFLDYMYHNFEFSLQKQYSIEKISCFLELSEQIFRESFHNRLSYDKSFDLFRNKVVQHGLFRPPHSILVFNLEEIKSITDLFLSTFYKHYSLYSIAFTPIINMQIITFEMFKTRFPRCLDLDPLTCKEINKNDFPALREYLVDKETGLTKEELEDIMKGDSIHHVPLKKREEWLALKAEREQKNKIDRVMKKEIEKLYQKLEETVKIQDEEFLNKVNDFKAGKKK